MTTNTAFKVSPVNTAERAKLDIRPGTTVRVWQKIQEKGKTRLQAFEGMVIARKHNVEAGGTFTVRKVSSGVGVEKIFPLYSPMIDKIEIVKRSKVRRAKLYYIREKAKKEVRRRMKQLSDLALGKREGQEAEARASSDEPEPVVETEPENSTEEKTETPEEIKTEAESKPEEAEAETKPNEEDKKE